MNMKEKSSIKNWQIQQYMQIKIHHDKEEFIAGMQGRNSIYISLNLKMKRTIVSTDVEKGLVIHDEKKEAAFIF